MPNLQTILELYKEIGETPLECLERFRSENPEYRDIPMTYAGRLDPMAEGILLILVGEDCKKKEKYLGLSKTYEIEVLFGVETDTYDILGKITAHKQKEVTQGEVKSATLNFLGKFIQEYPPYSSKTVDGEQLFALAKIDNLPDEMPTKEVEIFSIEMGKIRNMEANKLLQETESKISKVKGDFRQEEILHLWRESLQGIDLNFQIAKLTINCSSGTYMRSMAHNLGKKLGTSALALSIKRIKIGQYTYEK